MDLHPSHNVIGQMAVSRRVARLASLARRMLGSLGSTIEIPIVRAEGSARSIHGTPLHNGLWLSPESRLPT